MILIPWWFHPALWLITATAIFCAWREYGPQTRKLMGAAGAACVMVAVLIANPYPDICANCTAWWCPLVGCW